MVCQRSIYLIPANPHDIYLSQEIEIIFTYNCNSSLCFQHLVIIFFYISSLFLFFYIGGIFWHSEMEPNSLHSSYRKKDIRIRRTFLMPKRLANLQ